MFAYRALGAVAVASLFLGFGSLALAASDPQATSPSATMRRAGVDPDRRRFEIRRLARELNSQFDSSQQQETASVPTPSLRDLGLEENNFGHTYFYYPLHLRTVSYDPRPRRFYTDYRRWDRYRLYYYHSRFGSY